jgi:hypothetical protein
MVDGNDEDDDVGQLLGGIRIGNYRNRLLRSIRGSYFETNNNNSIIRNNNPIACPSIE